MIDESVAKRYAKALFLISEKRRETAAALEDLKALARVLAPDQRVGRILLSPEIRLQDKRHALQRACEGKVLLVVALFVDLLLRKKRLALLPPIVLEFEDLVERAQGVQRAHLVSATAFTEAETRRLHGELERVTGGKIRLTSEVDPALLGGALVRIRDRVIDRSVRSLLMAIEHQLEEVSV